MFYLAKFCRICIQAGGTLVDIETTDVDSITLSEKLEACTRMVISRESVSKEICMQCIRKLRICYDFQDMCKKSTRILEGYLKELISTNDKVNVNNFVNSELRVTITPLTQNSLLQSKRRRITKEERCSLLKKLLSSNDKSKDKGNLNHHAPIRPPDSHKGGLKDIINFTSNYDFGYQIDKNHNLEATPLDKLTAFSHNFFRSNLTKFSQSLLEILDNQNQYDSDEDDMFNEVCEEEESPQIKVEELVIEPDIKREIEDEENDYECAGYAANFVETTMTDCDFRKQDVLPECSPSSTSTASNNKSYEYISPVHSQTSSMNMLDKFVEKFSNCKIFSKHSIRCRTRGSPYINPHLRQQFQQRCFKCNKCSRYFKSPGYLKAHISKIHLSRVNN